MPESWFPASPTPTPVGSTSRRWCSAAAPRIPTTPAVTSEQLAALLPSSELVEPPWPDTEWIDRARGLWQGFERWPLLAPQLLEWADRALPGVITALPVRETETVALPTVPRGAP